MSQLPDTILQHPTLKPGEDFFLLRREGINWISRLGSRQWTDYNLHDPGITILEAACYALTELTYRCGWDIKDILSAKGADQNDPFPDQAFFSAREILTVNPWTPDDFRRLLIDLDLVRNAWVFCKECACDLKYYAWCEEDQLKLSYQKPAESLEAKPVAPRGLYDVLLELEEDPELGDLNDRKIAQTFYIEIDGAYHPFIIELRFQAWDLVDQKTFDAFVSSTSNPLTISVTKFSRYKVDINTISDSELQQYWRTVFYVSFKMAVDSKDIVVNNASLRVICDAATKIHLKIDDSNDVRSSIIPKLIDGSPTGFIQSYRRKLQEQAAQVYASRLSLNSHRNLDEDYCRIKIIDVEDVAVCADVEVAPDADIERVQAKIWFAIEQYFNPPVPLYTLKELMEAEIPVDDIFKGPALDSGFVKENELKAAGLKTELRVSDIINLLMDIEGVVAVNNLMLTKYDSEGNPVSGDADPTWIGGVEQLDPNKTSASWLLLVSELHQPRLYHNLSTFLFFKNGLPFLPRMDEAYDTLTQLRGEAERPKIKSAPKDLPVPTGIFRNPEEYFPLQYSFPLTYGIGPAGLPSNATVLRIAQAKQMKAYLLVFEQLLGNALAQLAHSASLFSLDPAVNRTYFVHTFTEALIQGYDALIDGLDETKLGALAETSVEYHDRRNRFLDHLLSRFGEDFREYALMLTNWKGQQTALDRLIDDKISFLKEYPLISSGRGKGFDYSKDLCTPGNISVLKKRISLLLGYPDLSFEWTVAGPVSGTYNLHFQLKDKKGGIWLEGDLTVPSADPGDPRIVAYGDSVAQMVQPEAYQITVANNQFLLQLNDKDGHAFAKCPIVFSTKGEAESFRDELSGWSSNERGILVEHLVLRPKFPGDALYPACADGPCMTCGDEDPYSFRLTFVMPGWTAPFDRDLHARDFADRTIRQETPSHLLGKICWVGNDGFIENPCDQVVDDLADLLIATGKTKAGIQPNDQEACDCSLAIYKSFTEAFKKWYQDKMLDYFHSDALMAALTDEVIVKVDRNSFTCTTVLTDELWIAIQAIMIKCFHHVALEGWQFERFEDAWCRWLHANAAFDWTDERLLERVTAMLSKDQGASNVDEDKICGCAAGILATYGMSFYNWMEANFKAGHSLGEFTAFTPDPVATCTDFQITSETRASIESFLLDRYTAYKEVSYRLRIVVDLLSRLRNIYPAATLHDCDDGSDLNPVRLGGTALGTNPPRLTEQAATASVVSSGVDGVGTTGQQKAASSKIKPSAQRKQKKLPISKKRRTPRKR